MRDGYTRLIIFLVIFTAGFVSITLTGTERLVFDEGKIEARYFLHTICRMGEVSEASFLSFYNSLPRGRECFFVRISCPNNGISDSGIREELSAGGRFVFDYGEEIMIEMDYGDHSFICRGRVNGSRGENSV